jgi:hypothetical protein
MTEQQQITAEGLAAVLLARANAAPRLALSRTEAADSIGVSIGWCDRG